MYLIKYKDYIKEAKLGDIDKIQYNEKQFHAAKKLQSAYIDLRKSVFLDKYILIDHKQTHSEDKSSNIIWTGVDPFRIWLIRSDGSMKILNANPQIFDHWFIPKSKEQLMNILYIQKSLGIGLSIEQFIKRYAEPNMKVKNAELDPYDEEEWGENGIHDIKLPNDDTQSEYLINICDIIRFRDIAY